MVTELQVEVAQEEKTEVPREEATVAEVVLVMEEHLLADDKPSILFFL